MTLKKADRTTTTDLEETMKMMADYLIPKDEATDDTEHHKKIGLQAKEKIQTTEDREYTTEEIKNAIEELKPKKSTRGRCHHCRNISDSIQTNPDNNLHNI